MKRRDFSADIFVGNLPTAITEEELAQLFDSFGLVMGVVLSPVPADGTSPRAGYLGLAPPTAVARAIKELDGTKIGGKPIRVEQVKEAVGMRAKRKPKPKLARPTAEAIVERARATRKPVVVEYRNPRRRIVPRP